MGILRRVRNIPQPSGKQVSKKPDRKLFTFFKRNVAQEKRAMLKRGRREKVYAVMAFNIKKNFKKFLSFKETEKYSFMGW